MSFLAVGVLFLSSTVTANPMWSVEQKPGLKYEILCHKEDPTRCVLRMQPGEKAPFNGILYTFEQSAYLQVKGDPTQIQKKIDIEVSRTKKSGQNDLELERKKHAIDNMACSDKIKNIEDTAKFKMQQLAVPFYEQPAFVIPVTVATTLGVVAASVFIACELRGCE